MRMWMVDPEVMCNQHILGEHVELHMLVGHLNKGKRINGFLVKGLLEPSKIRFRHRQLVAEMSSRGMNHKSALPVCSVAYKYKGCSVKPDSLKDLLDRCEVCRDRFMAKAIGKEV